jgi:hypothetical protein
MSTNDHHKPDAFESATAPPQAASAMPVTRLISRPSVQVVDGRLVAVLNLVERSA